MSRRNNSNTDRILRGLSRDKKAPLAGLVFLLLLYAAAYALVIVTIHSDEAIMIMRHPTPVRMLTGVFSSVSNLCIILLVVLYKKKGFAVSMVLLASQFVVLFLGIFVRGDFSNLSGMATSLLTLATAVLLHLNNRRVGRYQKKIRMQAVTDVLTGLPNRFALNEFARDLIRRGEGFAVATFDLDNFKNINNTMGHSTGDEILKGIASRWRAAADQGSTGTKDFVAYNNGDEFALIVRGYDSGEALVNTLMSYEDLIEEKMTMDNCDYFVTSSVGYAEYPADAETAEAVISHANAAMYEAKRNGERLRRFTKDLSREDFILETERTIRYALDNDTVFFRLQPQFDTSHKLRGFEALARMNGQDGGMVSPADFIPVAESVGLIDRLDNAVFRKSAEFVGGLVRETGSDVILSVNISVRHLMKNDFLDEVKDIVENCGMPANQIEIEITESVMIDSVDRALECIHELKKMGIRIAIDDFGTGYSSLSYLNTFPADIIKIDKAFIDQMNSGDSSQQYVSSIVSIGHIMDFGVVAEGVEEEDQLETLRELGCDFIQGFIWGRPLEADAAARLVTGAA